MVNKFPILIRTLKDIQSGKSGLKIFREELKTPAELFNKHIVDWLKNKKYPLRRGRISNPHSTERVDELYGQTPTERLHPGSLALWQAQRYRIRKIRGIMSLRVIFENLAEHAPLFFEEIKPPDGPIAHHDATKRLRFWAGQPLPWHPPGVRGWGTVPGPRYPKRVQHPGHMNYGLLVKSIFNENYKNKFISARKRAAKRISVENIRKALQ